MTILFCTRHVRRSRQDVPLAAGCLAAALPASLRPACDFLDVYPDQSTAQTVDLILSRHPDAVLFPVYVWNRRQIIRLVEELRRAEPGLALIGGGPEASGSPHALFSQAPWTALVCGEGEAVITRLMKGLSADKHSEPIPGVLLKSEKGLLDGGPAPLPDLARVDSPWLTGMLQPGEGVTWEVARGCAFSCDYCFDARGQDGVRPIPTQRLVKELALFIKRGVSQVWVIDSTFNYPPERGVALLEMLLGKAPGLHYHLEAKADYLDRRTISLLGKLNCSVQIGLQSVHKKVLQKIHRTLDLDILAEKIHQLEAAGVIYGFDLIYGLPGDSATGFRQSVDTVLEFAPNHIHVFPLSLLPGTRLDRQRDDYGIQAQPEPPYEILSSADWTAEEIAQCQRLAAAIDLFYNTGRAVAFLPPLLHTLEVPASRLFEDFFTWASQQPDITHEALMDTETWAADDVYRLLQGYLTDQLRRTGKAHLISVFLDLLCYHYHYAETLLGEELPPAKDSTEAIDLWEQPWKRAPQARLVPFAYEILDLLEMEGLQLEEAATLFRPVGSVALFLRRDNDVYCESLGEEMLRLLQKSDGHLSPREIFAGSVSRATGEEIVRFAISEGLLVPS